ncbi:MAG: TolC family protein [Vicinamibacterales bacterium]
MAGAQSLALTEADVLARLTADSVRVRAINSAIAIARAEALDASRLPNPRVSVERQAVAGVTEYYASVSQSLPVTGRRPLERLAASALVSASESRADDEVRRLRADVRLAFADLVSAQTRERHLGAMHDHLRELSQILTRREQAGDAAGFDRLRAEREVLDVESDLVVASTDRAQAQARLAAYIDDVSDPRQIVAVVSAQVPRDSGDVPALEALLERAETRRGLLAAYRHDVAAARFSAQAADRRKLPEPEVVLGTKSSTAGSSDGGGVTVGSGATGPLIGIQASVALFDRGRPERARALARASQAESEAAAFRAALKGEVLALREAVIQRRIAAARYRRDAIDRATELERIAQVSYDAGERGILELLDAYRLGASARLRQAQLDLAVRQSEIELDFTSGWEMPQ